MRFFLILLSFQFWSSFAQVKTNAEIEYQFLVDADITSSMNCSLFINNNVSIYQQKASTLRIGLPGSGSDDSGLIGPSIIFEPYMKIDHSKKEILFFDMIGENVFLVQDNYNKLSWQITDEKKVIAGYQCIKATVKFRGRDWIAWFAPEVPLTFGP